VGAALLQECLIPRGVFFAFVVATALSVGLPAAILWGWVRWARGAKTVRLFPSLSLTGISLATTSGLLAITGIAYAHVIGGFPFWDPRLLRIYRWGFSLSLVGLVLALTGAWKPNSLRWHGVGCSLGMLLFWLVAARGE
jgi:hypothetical protein